MAKRFLKVVYDLKGKRMYALKRKKKSKKSVIVAPERKIANGNKLVTVHYIGKLSADGVVFDSTIGGSPVKFPLGRGVAHAGFDDGVTGMVVGESRTITVPPEMGYGEEGFGDRIPPHASLTYEIHLIDVEE